MCVWWGVYRDKRTTGADWREAKEAREAFAAFSRLASRFGLTPLDRQALQVEQKSGTSKEKKFFGIVA